MVKKDEINVEVTATSCDTVANQMNPAISKYMREMQALSATSRWSGISPAERSAKMKTLRAKAKRKPKRSARLSDAPDQRPGESPKIL